MIICKRTNSESPDFQKLVKALDADLSERNGDQHGFYDQFNKIDSIKHAIVAYENEMPVGCGAIKEYSGDTMEVKRMYVPPANRGKGIASHVLSTLETWAGELNYKKCILETGEKQPEAIRLYIKNNYSIIPNYGQYEGVSNSICFEKTL
ncbi:MAG: GNAT family N-acetyltransferase [Bacteroidetes bacterium]|jgi:GNAT superfamily N-acetyltransferase|nr:GNAT family N-acetyltransferase [Bacteroidota bacterium]MBP6402403.1 GNAT family N-acetyltransferase [Bacteroidia bacterium]